MYQKLWNFLRGNVLLSVECPMPERVFNLCAAHDIPFWDVRWQDPERFTLRTTRYGAYRLKSVTENLPVTLEKKREKGAPVVLRRFRKRYVLLFAAVLLVALMWCGGSFIWDFEVTGNETVSEEAILRALEKQGITVGSRSRFIDQETLRNHILLELKDLSWLAVNVSGCTAHVQVVERHRPPELMTDGECCNLVAAKAGLVTKVEALDGKAQVQKGDMVTMGQLLVSGVADSPFRGMRLMHSQGRIYGRTWYDLQTSVPLTVRTQGETVKKTTHLALIFGKQRINIWGRGSVLGESCAKITLYHRLSLPFAFRLPVTLAVEKVTAYESTEAVRTEVEAQREGELVLLRQLRALMAEDGTVTAKRFDAEAVGDTLVVTLRAECCEQLAISVPIES